MSRRIDYSVIFRRHPSETTCCRENQEPDAPVAPLPVSRLLIFNKPYGVLCQFRDRDDRATLADYIDVPGVYPAGRLDRDSEGLVLLTDDGSLQHRISHPRFKLSKIYWVQVEGIPGAEALERLRRGVDLKDGPTRRAMARRIPEPDDIWPRDPPIRYRARIPTAWISLSIQEGRNRQVRRMTSTVGLPTLRLIRYAVGGLTLDELAPGTWRIADPARVFNERWTTIKNRSRDRRDRRPRESENS